PSSPQATRLVAIVTRHILVRNDIRELVIDTACLSVFSRHKGVRFGTLVRRGVDPRIPWIRACEGADAVERDLPRAIGWRKTGFPAHIAGPSSPSPSRRSSVLCSVCPLRDRLPLLLPRSEAATFLTQAESCMRRAPYARTQ